jgi:outer membrane protein OmpA-like peptidoglycan-associated protein
MINTKPQIYRSTGFWLGLGCTAFAITSGTVAFLAAQDPRLAIANAEQDAAAALAGYGFSWASVRIEDKVAHISGQAPGEPERIIAYEVVYKALRPTMASADVVTGVASHITLAAIEPVVSQEPPAAVAEAAPVVVPAIATPPVVAIATPAVTIASSPGQQLASAPVAAVAVPAQALIETSSVNKAPSLAEADCKAEFADVLSKSIIAFASDSTKISPSSEPLLNQLAAISKRCNAYRLTIEGHTDESGSRSHNQQLSQRRAEAVQAAMISRGVAKGQLNARGFGSSQPVVKGTSEAAMSKNRRIGFAVLQPVKPAQPVVAKK